MQSMLLSRMLLSKSSAITRTPSSSRQSQSRRGQRATPGGLGLDAMLLRNGAVLLQRGAAAHVA
jgi:hypothetical protein